MKINLVTSLNRISGKYIVAENTSNYRYNVEATFLQFPDQKENVIYVNVGDVVNLDKLAHCYLSIFDCAINNGYKKVAISIFQGIHNHIDEEKIINLLEELARSSTNKLNIYVLVDDINVDGIDIDYLDKLARTYIVKEETRNNIPYGTIGMMLSPVSYRDINKDDIKYKELINGWIKIQHITKEELCNKAYLNIDIFDGYDNDNLPSKDELIAMAIALNLNIKDSEQLLKSGNKRFDKTDFRDAYIKALISKGVKDIKTVNRVLNIKGYDSI